MSQAFRVLEEVDGELVSPPIKPLLEAAHARLSEEGLDETATKQALMRLIEYLASSEGRTNANCVAVDTFFMLELDRVFLEDKLPDDILGIVSDLGGALHDTFESPHIAENFESTPEQLLGRIRNMM
jgi:hypothetical protein